MKHLKKISILACMLTLTVGVFGQTKKASKKDQLVHIETQYGTITAILYDQTPLHKANFLKLANEKFYDNLLFHRVIKSFMIQGGDPNSSKKEFESPTTMLGGQSVSYKIPAEFVPDLFHKKGALAAARDNNPKRESSGCQFYIVQGKKWEPQELEALAKKRNLILSEAQIKAYTSIGGTPHLDQSYTVFGQVLKGLAVVDSIAAQPTNPAARPTRNINMVVRIETLKKKKISKKYGYIFPQAQK
jgi:cyclophilin family peptidyl-prolyl cis-trans isomerase